MRDARGSRDGTPFDHSDYLPGVVFRDGGRRPNAHHMFTVFSHAADEAAKAMSAFTCKQQYPPPRQRRSNRLPDMFVRMFLHRQILLRIKRVLTVVNVF